MSRERSVFVRASVVAVALVLSLGLFAGAAHGKKKKGGKRSVTVAKTTPTVLPATNPRQPAGCVPFPFPGLQPCTTPAITPVALVPLTVGKKAKGKVVSPNSVSITYSVTGSSPANPTNPGSAGFVQLELTAPNGRTIAFFGPGFGDTNATSIGPVTVTPNSPSRPCVPDSSQSVTVCATEDSDSTVRPPNWAGTVGQTALAFLGGVPARGTWTVRARNQSTTAPATLTNVSITVGLADKPTSGKGK